ncbi:MAG: hypothetical protein ACOYIH_06540 [Candidatus Fimadaptatus sp.]|jgi:hypothetical protein
MDEKLASITELAELYNKLDAMGKGMLLGWAAALKMVADMPNDSNKTA